MHISRFTLSIWAFIFFLVCTCSGADDLQQLQNNTSSMRYAGKTNAPDFPEGISWLNTDHPLSIKELRGKVVLLDFWTYCCINCMHIIPDLKKLEEKYAKELVVVGVHSAKFETEKGTENIRQAILRYEIEHPVVNDKDFSLWRQYGVRAWPTLILIDPLGKVIGSLSGEGVYEPLDNVIGEVVQDFDKLGKIDRTPLNLTLEKSHKPASLLSYPGKIIADEEKGLLYFTDSNHNRIIISTVEGEVREVIGSGEAGTQDGNFESAQFFRPQGLTLDHAQNILYVADTENHLIRKIDLTSKTVQTIAGTGQQARFYNEEGHGTEVALNSPWDLLLKENLLYIAMAGPHQIWTLDINTLDAKVYAGSGREDIIDGPLRSAALAQPSGITTDGSKLYFADSEVSAVRQADFGGKGKVETLIGEGLFEFGDVDGSYPKARLQHPIGVAYHDGYVYVADTYNHKIKRVDPGTKILSTFIGTGRKGRADGDALSAQLFEPNGLTFAGDMMYITDTNNDLIRVFDMKTQKISTLQFTSVEKLTKHAPARFFGTTISLPEQEISAQAQTLEVEIRLPEGTKFNKEAPFSVHAFSDAEHVVAVKGEQERKPANHISIPIAAMEGRTVVTVNLDLYYCKEGQEAACFFKETQLKIPVHVTAKGENALRAVYDVQ